MGALKDDGSAMQAVTRFAMNAANMNWFCGKSCRVARAVIRGNREFKLRAMKLPSLLAIPLLLSGCASDVSPDDRDFFYGGWRNPEQSSRERMYGRKYAEKMGSDDVRHQMPTANPAE